MSGKDYQIFIDILAFDITYKINSYHNPLMIMVGVNHHYQPYMKLSYSTTKQNQHYLDFATIP